MAVKRGLTATIVLLAMVFLGGCAQAPSQSELHLVRVPQDATLAEAGSLVADGGIILIGPGTYQESLEVTGDDITVRGQDRNEVILDGELTRSNGVIATGARVTVENLTVRNFLQSGVLITGTSGVDGTGIARGPDGYLPENTPPPVPGYLVQAVTASNNGLYGIYSFNRTGGIIRDNIATGGSDSGIYVGQCVDCNAVVTDNILMDNAVGLEFANASSVAVHGNRIVDNRVGISVLSNYLEAHGPTKSVVIAGNLIANNNETQTPVQADGGFGIGIGLGGTIDALVRANTISSNSGVGIWITSSEDFSPVGNHIVDNNFSDNALDLAYTPTTPLGHQGNCFELSPHATTQPDNLVQAGCQDPLPVGTYVSPPAPKGIMFSQVPLPNPRAGLATVDDQPRVLPDRIELPDLSTVTPPGRDLLIKERPIG